MSPPPPPRNRRERRAQANSPSNFKDDKSSIPLAQPFRGPPKSKTLLEIASERSPFPPSLSDTVETTTITPNGSLSSPLPSQTSPSQDVDVDVLEILLYALSLTLLHLTLTLLIENQYASTPPTFSSLPSKVWKTSLAASQPYILLVLVAILHPRAGNISAQVLFALMGVGCGCWLVKTTNRDPYLAAMARGPSLGTLWVWSVIELRWEVALATVMAVGGWGMWMGYGFW